MKISNIALAAVLCLGQAAHASILVYTSPLSGASEVPPVISGGTGFATVIVNTVAQTMEVQIVFSGLTSGTTASHIHCCLAVAGVGSAGVATTTPSFTGFPLGVTAGSFDGTLDLTSASSYNPAFVTLEGSLAGAEAALLAGLAAGDTYLNIHTTNNPGGEIRGFLQATPEPGTLLMAGAAMAAVGLLRRKRTL